ncbi:MAG TPA: response regulator transcription factor [Gemmatimonadales bacterium]|nr:response regulator transcription factor [Gemmatimonadales bacterium]
MAKRIPVLVVADNRLVRDGITTMLDKQADLRVVAAVDRAAAALERARKLKPDVVLVNAALGDHDSYRFVAQLKQALPKVRVIVMDVLPVAEDVLDFVNAGVAGFIAKDATLNDFVRTVRAVAGGTDVLPAALTGTLFSHIANLAVGRKPPEAIRAIHMTRRERAVFDLITEGLSNKEIAQRLHLATNTVKGHVHKILEKLALRTRLQIAAYARIGGASASPSPQLHGSTR